VHTATIPPQQRRGDPVPQMLLDKVLVADAFWSQHRVKLHGRHQVRSVLVPIPSTQKQEGPSNQKTRQRRTRRPFSVAEAEALVHTIELVGIGRYDAINNISLPVCGYTTKLTF